MRSVKNSNTAVDGLDDHHDDARGNESGTYGGTAPEGGAHGTSSRRGNGGIGGFIVSDDGLYEADLLAVEPLVAAPKRLAQALSVRLNR